MSAPRYRVPALALRMAKERTLTIARETIATSDEAADVARALIGDLPTERLIAICLDGRHHVTAVVTLAQGGMHGCGVNVADVLRAVLGAHAWGFILAHNHPSGDPTPSPEDRTLTRTVLAASQVVGVPMLDHVIVTRGDAYACVSGAT